jgi:spermidine/putrescine transport system ATP-binding protein
LYRRPNSRRVAEFIGKMNFLPGQVMAMGEKITVDVAGLGRSEISPEQAPTMAQMGDTVVGIRPETLGILFDGETTSRRVTAGLVDEVVYYGDMTYYDVRIPGVDRPLTISMKNMIGRPVLEVGTPTNVVWDERSLVVLSA